MPLRKERQRARFLYIPYPSVEREIEIVKSKIPDADEDTVSKVVKIVHNIRNLNLLKKPSVRGTVDWVKSVSHLNAKNTNEAMKESIGVAIKNESDKKRVIKDVLDKDY